MWEGLSCIFNHHEKRTSKEQCNQICCQMVQWYQIRTILKYISHRVIHKLNLFCSGCHLGFPSNLKIENIVRDHPMVIHVEFRFNIFNFWFSIWSREESLSSDSDQNEQPPLTSNYWTQKRPQHMALEIQIQRN